MKNYYWLLLIALIAHVFPVFADDLKTNDWGQAFCNAQMSIKLKSANNLLRTNQPVIIAINIKNTSSNETISVYQSLAILNNSFVNFSFEVNSPSGENISGKPAELFNGGSGAIYQIAPGQTKEFEYALSSLCRFDKIGTYKTIAKKRLWPDTNKQCQITSNPLEIVISQ
ncbi:MAG TPA: hypothetical protein VK742_04195 [Candidatus Sulfotelmatobacter sp.]|jgi:hypothetical protein|nr:hypothetical protein [Candidatus Sulfotelmatobacter sp.]